MARATQPNVILVMTDDQGYGDLGCTGNPWIQTPNIDRFFGQSVRFTDFHVSPLCTPTRGGIMTGHYPVRNGAWATTWGRSMLRRDETTMADVFAESGYRTGMFGKWHLGDNYPYRPQDRGFQKVIAHKGGGVGQTPDFWGNNYFDDTYFHNGTPVAHVGYCTDVWFEEALTFIEENRDTPFFCYLTTNAPHGPYLVAERYKALYEENPNIPHPDFYGMITNIDENFGRLDAKLEAMGLKENTILIFMTDNGSSGGCGLDKMGFVRVGYNAGMRGMKGSFYDGGHRVPFFIRWPAAGLKGGRDVEDLASHVDLLPTFIDLCGLTPQEDVTFDGTSLAPLLQSETNTLPDRTIFVQNRQHTDPPEKWANAVMTRRWRLVHGRELYDIKADPGQTRNVADRHPRVVEQLRAAHERWWEEIEPTLEEYCPISLGNDAENPIRLDAMDVMGDVAWNQAQVAAAQKSTGRWAVDVEQPGTYRFRLRRWPTELDLPIDSELSEDKLSEVAPYHGTPVTHAIRPVEAELTVFDETQVVDVQASDHEVAFTREMSQTGVTTLDAWFKDADGERQGAYYVYVERLTPPASRRA